MSQNTKPRKQLRTGGKTGSQVGKIKPINPTPKRRSRKAQNPLVESSKQLLTYRIPDCVGHYFGALVNPFDTEAGACLPCDLFPLPSLKQRVFVRGSFGLGTSGVGFIAATPTAANDAAIIQHTDSTSVGTVSTAFNAFTNLNNRICVQNTYTQAQFSANVVGVRIVSFGIRVKYIGKLSDRNGVVACYEDPDGADTRSKTYNSVNSDPYSSIKRVGAEAWDCQVCHSGPVRPSDLEFQYITYPNSTAAPLIITMNGVAGDLYEYEYYQHHETIGTNVPGKSKSHGEAQLFGKLIETIKGETSNHPLMPEDGNSLWNRFKSSVAESLPRIYNAGKGAAQMVMGDYVGGLMSMSKAISDNSFNPNTISFPRNPDHDGRDRAASQLLLR